MGFNNAEEIEEMFLPVCDRVTEIKSGMDSIQEAMQHFQKFEDIKRHVADTKKCLCDAPKLLNSDQLAKSIIEYEKNLEPVENITRCIADGLKRIKNRYEELNTKENIYQDNKNVFETTMKLIESSIDIINSAVKVYTSPVNQFEAIRGGMKVIQSAYKEMKLEFAIFKRHIFGFRRSDHTQLIPPMVLSLSQAEQMTLKNKYTQQALTWTNSEPIQNEVSNFLEKCQPFFFYKNGQYSNASPATPIDRVVNVVCREIYWDHYFLVIGDDSGLEEELMQDIKIIASLAQLDDTDIKRLHNLLSSSDSKIAFCYGERAVLTLLIFPSASELKKILNEKMTLNPGRNFTIIYSGHALHNGSWVLPDGDSFDASDLLEVIDQATSGLKHFPPITIVLNCCYGWVFANDIGEIKNLTLFLELRLDGKCANLEQMVMDENNCLSEELNESITKALLYIYNATLSSHKPNTATILKKVNGFDVSVLPFSVGPLHAKGILCSFLNIPPGQYSEKFDWSSVRKPLARHDPLLNSEPPDPQLIVFPAHRGDSTLFRWHNFNMLVDGGYLMSSPCFWETVRRLPKLNVVVVTHFDSDHIRGILRLFKERNLPIDIGELYTVQPQPCKNKKRKSRSSCEDNLLLKKAKEHNEKKKKQGKDEIQVKDLITNPQELIIDKTFDNGNILHVFMVTPDKNDLQKAGELLPCEKNDSKIANAASASLLIKCYIKEVNEYRYALLTGDAPGNTIITRLADTDKVAKIPKRKELYCFDYIDMPHHGSASEATDPQAFLSQVESRLCVVSTNSIMYNHPDAGTVKLLNTKKIQMILFTYKAQRNGYKCNKKTIDRDIRKEFDSKCTYDFANNKIKDCNAKECIKVNLHTRQHIFCDNDSSEIFQ